MLSRKAKQQTVNKHVSQKISLVEFNEHEIKSYIRWRSEPDDEASVAAYINE